MARFTTFIFCFSILLASCTLNSSIQDSEKLKESNDSELVLTTNETVEKTDSDDEKEPEKEYRSGQKDFNEVRGRQCVSGQISNGRFSLEGRVAFVSGSSTGLGKSMAMSLGAAGAKVAINYANNQGRAEEKLGIE